MHKQGSLMKVAPCGSPTLYDQSNLALYAALLDADAASKSWREIVSTLMQLDPDHDGVERCWRSHLERARWIIGDGLAGAIEAFGTPLDQC